MIVLNMWIDIVVYSTLVIKMWYIKNVIKI